MIPVVRPPSVEGGVPGVHVTVSDNTDLTWSLLGAYVTPQFGAQSGE